MELLGMLILLGAVGAIILWPLLRRHPEALAAGGPQLTVPASPSGAARDRALAAIKELEFDYLTGKIAEEDYRALRARYDARAVEALTHLAAPPRPAGAGSDLDERLEAEIRAVRGRRFCVSCGGELPKAARFCPACGTAVVVRA